MVIDVRGIAGGIAGGSVISLVVLCTFALSGCGGGADDEPLPPPPPILIVGLDGLEWNVALPLIRAGRMPNLEALMNRGSYGYLQTFVPTFSPVLWTSVATGKRPPDHGILNFAHEEDGKLLLYDRRDRTTKAMWNVFSDRGREVHSIGWWMTFPVESIEGVMVAQTNTVEQTRIASAENVWKGTLRKGVPGQVHPPELQEQVLGVLEVVDEQIEELTRSIFGEMPRGFTALSEALWKNCMWAFRADATYNTVAQDLAIDGPPDLGMVYFGGTDVVGHRFWRYMQPQLWRSPPPPDQVENFHEIIRDYYQYIDSCLGELMQSYGPETNVLVLSDHGMGPVNTSVRFDEKRIPDNVNSGDHQQGPPGIFVAAGPSIRVATELPRAKEVEPSQIPSLGDLLDVAPTVYALHHLPLAADLAGGVMRNVLREDFPFDRLPAPVATYDDEAFRAGRQEVFQTQRGDEDERLLQLWRMGYLDQFEGWTPPSSDELREDEDG